MVLNYYVSTKIFIFSITVCCGFDANQFSSEYSRNEFPNFSKIFPNYLSKEFPKESATKFLNILPNTFLNKLLEKFSEELAKELVK